MWRRILSVALLSLACDAHTARRTTTATHAHKQPVEMSMMASQSSATATVRDSESKAKAAVVAAEAAVASIQKISMENNAFVPLVQGAASEAKVALQTALDSAAEAHKLVAETKVAADKAAMEAAKDYLHEVKLAATAATSSAAEARAKAETEMEVKAAKAAAAAVEPYHMAMMRGQKVQVAYQTRAQELAAASNTIKAQSIQLSGSADHYQLMGQTIQARQMMMQAHELFHYADMMKNEAQSLHGMAGEIGGAMPAYAEAAKAAAASAEQSLDGSLPGVAHPYFLQQDSVKRVVHAPFMAAKVAPTVATKQVSF